MTDTDIKKAREAIARLAATRWGSDRHLMDEIIFGWSAALEALQEARARIVDLQLEPADLAAQVLGLQEALATEWKRDIDRLREIQSLTTRLSIEKEVSGRLTLELHRVKAERDEARALASQAQGLCDLCGSGSRT